MISEPALLPIDGGIAATYMCDRIGEDPELTLRVLTNGEFFCFAPKGTADERLHKLSEGGLSGQNYSFNITREFANLIFKKPSFFGRVIYFQDPFAIGSNKGAHEKDLILIGENLYFILSEIKGEREVESAIKKYRSAWRFEAIGRDESLGRLSFSELIGSALSITIDAYDGESFLVWSSRRL
jgi:hypothetical protein